MGKPVSINKEEELIKACPKAITKLKEWLAKELQESMDPGQSDILVTMTLRYNPRILYDFFDDMKVYINPGLISLLVPKDGWGYEISYFKGGHTINKDEDQSYSSRPEAEEAAIREAFKILEDNGSNSTESKG
jgi:hypothetical protein